jgi:signal transduction histidine kinase
VAGMAGGDLRARLPESGNDEIGELSVGFNKMAGSIEEKMNELALNAKQKEDFTASFAHELKTPLTSVIGYADMLYQRDLTPEQTKNAAMYILSEGLRLEALSLKLMDLIVLGKQDFVLEDVRAEALLENVAESLRPLYEVKSIALHLDADKAIVKAEFDLLKTLLINLIDNAVKADCNDIWLSGKNAKDGFYTVSVTDNGRGIPAEELNRITEAFYMVDKSRARKQHGAGLGLALVSKIANIHGCNIRFKSEPGIGTAASIRLKCAGRRRV